MFYSFSYKKSGREFLTIRKVTLLSVFFSIFLIQAFITRVASSSANVMKFNLDIITIILVGFLIGPLEGILYGFITDSLRVLIVGWNYQILSMMSFPLMGLISGYMGDMY